MALLQNHTMSAQTRLSSLPTYQAVSQTRLKALYSDFLQQKHANPTSFVTNLEWWRRTLENIVLKGWQSPSEPESSSTDRLILHASGASFSEEFRFEGVGRPLSLAGIIVRTPQTPRPRLWLTPNSLAKAELTEAKSYVPLNQFLTDTKSIYDPGWLPFRIASFVVGKPLWWALQQLNIVNSDEYVGGHASDSERWRRIHGDYVVLSLLERAAEGVLQKQQAKNGVSLAESLYKFDGFRKEFAGSIFAGVTLSEQDMRVLLKFLERDRKVVVVDGEVNCVVIPIGCISDRNFSRLSSF